MKAEDKFEWICPNRNKKGDRRYENKDVIDIMAINILVNMAGMTLQGIKTAHDVGYFDELKKFFLDKHRNYQPTRDVKYYLQPLTLDQAYPPPKS